MGFSKTKTVTVELDKDDLIYLIRGFDPSYEQMKHFLIEPYGEYEGGFHNRWEWDYHKLMECNEELLLSIYNVCKTTKL